MCSRRRVYLGSQVLLRCIEQQLLQGLVKVYPQPIGDLLLCLDAVAGCPASSPRYCCRMSLMLGLRGSASSLPRSMRCQSSTSFCLQQCWQLHPHLDTAMQTILAKVMPWQGKPAISSGKAMRAPATAESHALPFSSSFCLSSAGSCTCTYSQKMRHSQIRAFTGICMMFLGTMCACRYCHMEACSWVIVAAHIHRICLYCVGAYLGGHRPRDASRLPLLAVSLLACRTSIPARPAVETRAFKVQM